MQLHATLVTLLNHPLQRIPVRRRSLSLLSCKEAAPRFDVAFIQRITLCSYLKEDGVDAVLLQLVELIGKCLLHLLCGHSDELSVYALYPSPAKLSLLRHITVRRSLYGYADHKQRHKKENSRYGLSNHIQI